MCERDTGNEIPKWVQAEPERVPGIGVECGSCALRKAIAAAGPHANANALRPPLQPPKARNRHAHARHEFVSGRCDVTLRLRTVNVSYRSLEAVSPRSIWKRPTSRKHLRKLQRTAQHATAPLSKTAYENRNVMLNLKHIRRHETQLGNRHSAAPHGSRLRKPKHITQPGNVHRLESAHRR